MGLFVFTHAPERHGHKPVDEWLPRKFTGRCGVPLNGHCLI
jgi:hypothetical protein